MSGLLRHLFYDYGFIRSDQGYERDKILLPKSRLILKRINKVYFITAACKLYSDLVLTAVI